MSFARLAIVVIAVLQLPFEPQTNGTPLVGVVEVPALLNVYGPAGEPVVPENVRIPLRARPSADSAVLATITKPGELATVEYQYEELAAMVHAREGTWSLVKSSNGTAGWMAPDDSGPFHSLEQLLDEHLAYLTDAWDGHLFAGPGSTDRVPIPADPDRRFVGYIEPTVRDVRIVLQPGQDGEPMRDAYRQAYRAIGVGSSPGPDGTRILSLEPGVIVPLFETPNELTSITAHLQTNRVGEVLQTTHQTPSQVLVFEARPGWYQVARENDGEWRHAPRLWMQASPVWRFRPVADDQQMTELARAAWGPERRDVRVTGVRTVNDVLWVAVELITAHDCGGPGAGVVRARGWVPAHAASGDLNVWYHPRGC